MGTMEKNIQTTIEGVHIGIMEKNMETTMGCIYI